MIKTLLLGDFIMLTAPVAKTFARDEKAHALSFGITNIILRLRLIVKRLHRSAWLTQPTARKFKTITARTHIFKRFRMRAVLQYWLHLNRATGAGAILFTHALRARLVVVVIKRKY